MLTKRQYEILKAVTVEADIFEESDIKDIDFLLKNQLMYGVPMAHECGLYPYQVSDTTSGAIEEYELYHKKDIREERNTKLNFIAVIISGIALIVSIVAIIISSLC